jgi:prepilin-type N-terminal cleavage/methylation domain-containing protein
MDNFCKIRRGGFTLVELLIAMAVGIVIIAAVYSAMNLALRFSANTDRKVITQQDTRAVLDLMAMEIRMASYNPTRATTIWRDPTSNNCTVFAANQANKGIQIADASNIAVEMDINPPPVPPEVAGGDGNIATGPNIHENEVISYSYDGVVFTINRATNCGNPQAILGGGFGTNVVNAATVPSIPLFQYFDRNDQPTALIPNIRRIQITIVTDTLANDTTQTGTPRPRRMIYSTSVIVRNHALSP